MRKFTGVFIPANVYLDKDLTPAQKLLLAEIIALASSGRCVATNGHFAEHLDTDATRISKHIARLEELNYIAIEHGKLRALKPTPKAHGYEGEGWQNANEGWQNDKAGLAKRQGGVGKMTTTNTSINTNEIQQQQTRTSATAPDPFATPPPVARFLSLEEIVDECKTDNEMHMLFHRRQVPLELYAQYLDAFVPHYKAMNQTANRKDFRSHFLNWSEKRHRASKTGATGGYDTLKRFT